MPDDPSTLDSLSSSNENDEIDMRHRRGLPAWLLPFGLILGFLLVLALLFGSRLLPAIRVKVAPVITIRGDTSVGALQPGSEQSETRPKGQLLFQASGWIEPDPFPISVSTLISGIVDEVYVLEGDSVKKNQPLAKLVDEDAILNLADAKAEAETLKAEIEATIARIPVVESRRNGSVSNVNTEKSRLAEIQDRYHRLQSLPQGSIPQIDLTAAKLQLDQQQSQVNKATSDIPGIDSEIEMIKKQVTARRAALRRAEVAVAKAQLALDRTLIRSPMDGTVLLLHAAPGRKRFIQMDDSKSAYIVELFDPQKLQARIDVPLSEARSLSVGQPVEMICDLLPNLTLNGIVSRITGEADLQRNTLQVKVAINNPDPRLRPEMLVRGKFYPTQATDTGAKSTATQSTGSRLSIYVPEQAIFDSNQVWVASPEGIAERRTLTLAKDRRDEHQLAIEGIRSGERVILPPHRKLKSGARIKIIP